MRAWTMDMFLYMLLCTNGAKVLLDGDSLIQRRHTKSITDDRAKLMTEAWQRIPTQRDGALKILAKLTEIPLAQPLNELRQQLLGLPAYIQEAAQRAFNEQPGSTAYHVFQAMTRIGVAAQGDSGLQDSLQGLGGAYAVRMLHRGATQAVAVS
jgi:hypothetical protein